MRPWTNRELSKLYRYSKKISQKEAAKKLNRTYRAVRSRCELLGIRWFQGFFTFTDIANEAGCNAKQVKRFAVEYMKNGVPGIGEGIGFRARIPPEDAEDIIYKLKEIYSNKDSGRWSRKEKAKLYALAGTMGMPEVAEMLGRSKETVTKKCSDLGIKWRQGTWSISSIAREVGVSNYIVKKTLDELYPRRKLFYDSGKNRRYTIGYEEAERIMEVLNGDKEDS